MSGPGQLDLTAIMARHLSWFMVVLLISMTEDLTSLAHTVTFPTDQELRIHLPEWVPRERGARDANWKHSRVGPSQFDNRRIGEHKH